jgi:hypothetical protein
VRQKEDHREETLAASLQSPPVLLLPIPLHSIAGKPAAAAWTSNEQSGRPRWWALGRLSLLTSSPWLTGSRDGFGRERRLPSSPSPAGSSTDLRLERILHSSPCPAGSSAGERRHPLSPWPAGSRTVLGGEQRRAAEIPITVAIFPEFQLRSDQRIDGISTWLTKMVQVCTQNPLLLFSV